MMQMVVEFAERSFWGGRVSGTRLNEKVADLNMEGWRVVSIATNQTIWGHTRSYSLLVERVDDDADQGAGEKHGGSA